MAESSAEDRVPEAVHITRGDRGEAVRDLKRRLTALGHESGAGDAPDDFGPATDQAVRTFQRLRGLRVDGVCGAQTWSALVESGYALGDRLLYHRRPMLRGDDVGALQRALNALGFDAGKEDGILGPDTVEALREFQRNAGITVDGICGPETLAALERVARGQEGSVAQARERDVVRRAPGGLAGRRVFVAVEPGLETLAEVVREGLARNRAEVVVEAAASDQSVIAAEANRFDADVVLLLRLGDERGCWCGYYGSGNFRSERGHRMASCVIEEMVAVLGGAPRGAEGKTLAILRETRAPAVVCEPVAAGDVDALRMLVAHAAEVGRAIVTGLQRGSERPPDDEG